MERGRPVLSPACTGVVQTRYFVKCIGDGSNRRLSIEYSRPWFVRMTQKRNGTERSRNCYFYNWFSQIYELRLGEREVNWSFVSNKIKKWAQLVDERMCARDRKNPRISWWWHPFGSPCVFVYSMKRQLKISVSMKKSKRAQPKERIKWRTDKIRVASFFFQHASSHVGDKKREKRIINRIDSLFGNEGDNYYNCCFKTYVIIFFQVLYIMLRVSPLWNLFSNL